MALSLSCFSAAKRIDLLRNQVSGEAYRLSRPEIPCVTLVGGPQAVHVSLLEYHPFLARQSYVFPRRLSGRRRIAIPELDDWRMHDWPPTYRLRCPSGGRRNRSPVGPYTSVCTWRHRVITSPNPPTSRMFILHHLPKPFGPSIMGEANILPIEHRWKCFALALLLRFGFEF